MTPKFLARMITPRSKYARCLRGLVTEGGREFTWVRDAQFEIGDIVWIAKRLPVAYDGWCFEIYQVTLEPSGYGDRPRTWFCGSRYIVEPT